MAKKTHMRSVKLALLLLFLLGYNSAFSQDAESKTVEFMLNNLTDTEPPEINILTPEIKRDRVYRINAEEMDLIGEVKDEGEISFVSVNSEIREVNESGIFTTRVYLIPGENLIRIIAMDKRGNLQEQIVKIEYTPPVITLADRIAKESTYYGLLIGINDYNDPDIPDLDNPISDAEKFYNTLTRNYTFEPENIRILKNPERDEIIRVLDQLRNEITSDDNLLIFYAGHGYWEADSRIGYWLPSDATRETTADWFRNSTLVDYLQAIKSKHTLLITDACFAGSIFKARSVSLNKELVYEKIYDLPSRKAMTSGTLTEVPDQSAFIKYLIQRLDENRETYLSSEELYSSFRMAVISNSNVVPQYGEIQNVGNEGGDFIFLKKK